MALPDDVSAYDLLVAGGKLVNQPWVSPQHSGKWCFDHGQALPDCTGCAEERKRLCECCEFVNEGGKLRRQGVGDGHTCDKCTRQHFVVFTGTVEDIDPKRRAGPFNTASLQFEDVRLIERVRERCAKIADPRCGGMCGHDGCREARRIAAKIRSGQ